MNTREGYFPFAWFKSPRFEAFKFFFLLYPSRNRHRCSKTLIIRSIQDRLLFFVFCFFEKLLRDSNSSCKGRGCSSAAGRFGNKSSEHLEFNAFELCRALSKFPFKNKSRAKEVLKNFFAKTDCDDPERVSEGLCTMIMNLLSK